MFPVTMMRAETDCEEAACSTATGRSWEEIHDALGKRGMPNSVEDPLASNPENVRRALAILGFDCHEKTWADMQAGNYTPGRLVFLAHLGPKDPEMGFSGQVQNTLRQHWVVLMGKVIDATGQALFVFEWGNGRRVFGEEKTRRLFLDGWPNCAFEPVYISRPRRFWRWAWDRITSIFRK